VARGTPITAEIIELIKEYRINDKLGSGKISAAILKDHKLDVGISTITKVLKNLKNQGIKGIDIAPSDLAAAEEQRITPKGEKRNIYKKIRPVVNYDRKTNPNLPVDANFKVQLPSGSAKGSSTTTEYFKTEKDAKAGIETAEKRLVTNKQIKAKPFDNAVKEIHKIALKNPDDINDVKNLAKLVYGDNKLRQLTDISNDLVRYQNFLLGFKEIPGIKSPIGNKLDDILTEFPSQNQWGKFASNELRRSKFDIRDKILNTKGPKLATLRTNVLKAIDTGVYNLDEAMGLSATFEKAPGYTELGQVIEKKVNTLKGRQIDKPFSMLFKDVTDGKADLKDVEAFNKKSMAFQTKHGIDTPIIEYKPGEKLDASKFVKHFDKLSPEAQLNVNELAQKGIALKSKSMPINFLTKLGNAKTAIPAAAMTFLATKANSTPTYNSEIGAIVKPGTSDDVESQSGLLDWAAANPELTATAAVGGAGLTTAGNTLLRGLIKTMGTPALGVGLAGSLVADNMSKGESLPEALADPMAGASLLGSSSFSKGLGSLLGGAKIARSLTPVGAAMTAAGLGKDYYDFASDEIDKMDAMSDYDRRIYNDMLMDDTNIDF